MWLRQRYTLYKWLNICVEKGHGKQLWIMQGMFKANGGCGYVKKPRILLDTHALFDPCKRLPVKTTLKVKIYTGEGWDLDFPQTHFDQYSPPDFFVKVPTTFLPPFILQFGFTRIVLCCIASDWNCRSSQRHSLLQNGNSR